MLFFTSEPHWHQFSFLQWISLNADAYFHLINLILCCTITAEQMHSLIICIAKELLLWASFFCYNSAGLGLFSGWYYQTGNVCFLVCFGLFFSDLNISLLVFLFFFFLFFVENSMLTSNHLKKFIIWVEHLSWVWNTASSSSTKPHIKHNGYAGTKSFHNTSLNT